MRHVEHAIITGGGGGIGRAIALGLRGRGAEVTSFDRKVPEQVDGIHDLSVDVTDLDQMVKAFQELRRKFDLIIT